MGQLPVARARVAVSACRARSPLLAGRGGGSRGRLGAASLLPVSLPPGRVFRGERALVAEPRLGSAPAADPASPQTPPHPPSCVCPPPPLGLPVCSLAQATV